MADHNPFPVDLETLLAPISTRQPAGEWLRYEGTYDTVQEARREEDDTLPKGIWQSKAKRADWAKVDALCQQALRERTKDLQIAAWLAEAWLLRYGPRGFAQGLLLCSELLNRFWDTLYPVLGDADDDSGEGDTEFRLAPLEFVNRKVGTRLKLVPLTQSLDSDEGRPPLCFADWERALHNEKLGSAGNPDELVPALFLAAAAATPPARFVALHAELTAADQAAAAVEEAVSQHTGERNLVMRNLRALITDILVLIAQYTPATPAQPSSTAAGGAADDPQSEAETSADYADRDKGAAAMERARSASDAPSGPIKSRGEAYQRLTEAADYLLRTEPHSPVPYLVKRAVAWGNMNLTQLLTELVTSDADRLAIYALLGVKAPQ